jgi:hypothetical protein
MRRIKIVKVYSDEQYDYESTETVRTITDGIDWHEVDDKRVAELEKLISFANQYRYELKANYLLRLVEEITPSTVEQHLEKAKELYEARQEKLRKQQEKEEKARIAREEKRKATELERKRKQLEKLQKELDGIE